VDDWLIYCAAIIPVTVLAGLARGVAGFGGPFIMVPVFNLFFPPATTIVVVLVINMIGNLKLLPDAWREKTNRATIPLAVGTIPSIFVGGYILLSLDPGIARTGINATILVCALLLLSGWRYHKQMSFLGYTALGVSGGLVLGATSIAVQMGLFLQAGQNTARQGRANFNVWACYASLLAIGIAFFGTSHDISNPWLLVALVPIYFAGLSVGLRIYNKIADETLRKIIIWFVMVITSVSIALEYI
jgi:uncharacterized membrane protein YfcA